jgi:hypothetical protein
MSLVVTATHEIFIFIPLDEYNHVFIDNLYPLYSFQRGLVIVIAHVTHYLRGCK